MIRKPPLRTYQKKKTAQSTFSYTQSSLWESRSPFNKIKSSIWKKNETPPSEEKKDIEELSSCYFDTTFDRMAKTARLPPPPQQESHSSINISSDVPEPSPIKIEVYKFPPKKELPKSKASKRPKRKPNPSVILHEDVEVIVKKRLKHGLMNISNKKSKAVRNSKRKVSANNKTSKNVRDDKKTMEIDIRKGLTPNDSGEWFIAQPVKSDKETERDKKEKNNGIREKTGGKSNVMNRRNAGRGRPKVFNSIDTSNELNHFSKLKVKDEGEVKELREIENKENILQSFCCSVDTSGISIDLNRTQSKVGIKDSPGFEYVKNFRRYSASKYRENNDLDPVDSKKYRRILTKQQYTQQIQSVVKQKKESQKLKDASDDLKSISNTSKNKKDLEIKPCSIVLLKCDENKDPILSGRESTVVEKLHNAHSSEDIFQSSISNTGLNIVPESQDPIKMRLHESKETDRAQFLKNQSEFFNNVSFNAKPCVVKITDHEAKKSLDRNHRCDPNRSLHYLKCSTPISAYVKIDRSINRLSPIVLRENTCLMPEKSVDESEIDELVATNNIVSSMCKNKECFDVPKTNIRRRSVRKRLSISYEGDESSETSDGYCEIAVENYTNRKGILHNITREELQSPTSEIQESPEILKLSLGNSTNKQKCRSSQKEIVTIYSGSSKSGTMFEKGNKCDDTNELTGKSKDTCSQLTPIGIINTRSGRQLKLSMSTEKKFFNDSNARKTHPGTPKITEQTDFNNDYEIIDDSETVENGMVRSRITKHRGTRFTIFKSHSKPVILDDVKSPNSTKASIAYQSDSLKMELTINISKVQASNNAMFHESNNLNASSKLMTMSPNRGSKCSTQDYEKKSEVNDLTSVFDDEKNSTSVSFAGDPPNTCATLSDKEISQSIIESTKNFDSLNIRSSFDDKSESPATSINNTNNSDTEWTTLSSNSNDECTTSSVQDKTMEESDKDNQLVNLSSSSNKSSSISDYNELDSDHSSEVSNEGMKIAHHPSADFTELALMEKMKLLSTKINTRKRRKTLKPVTENISQMFEEQAQSSEHSISTNSFDVGSRNGSDLKENDKTENITDSLDEAKDSNLFVKPLDVDLKINFQPRVVLEKLDPVIIAANERQNWGLGLTAIHEISDENSQTVTKNCDESVIGNDSEVGRESDHFKRPDNSLPRRSEVKNLSLNGNTSASDSDYSVSKLNVTEPKIIGRPSVFLKPGKDWTRSLSILNNIQNGSDLDLLSTGKGKNWRKSVQAILDMQQERVIQSCFGKNEDDKGVQIRSTAFNCTSISERAPCSEEQSIGSASPGRFIPRMSIRVVPENKRLSHVEDTSFLEAYGITASKSRNTLSRRSKSKCRKTLVYDVQCEDAAIKTVGTERLVTARDVVLQRCCQDDYLSFEKCFPTEYLENCRKIGEGVYGEVFLYEQGKQKSVIKIIPIEGDVLVNGERQKRFDEILSEIVIAKELHNLRYGEKYQTHGFVEVKNIRCISGKYPEKLIELWKAYDEEKGSDNDCPSMFDENQLYITLELGHGGQDLEAFVFQSAVEAHALFVQASLALAVAEQSLEFEHRDLHWGNVLISHTKESRVAYKLNNKEYLYPTKGMQVAIIDFTLSRMSYEGCCIFNDLALDPALFTAQGEYQFEIYRLMREKIGNNWQKFEPYTNVLWLHYTLDKMITALRYKRKTTKVHKEAISRLQELKEVVLNYDSAFDFVTNCEKVTSFQC